MKKKPTKGAKEPVKKGNQVTDRLLSKGDMIFQEKKKNKIWFLEIPAKLLDSPFPP